jgi:hypothetical protein
LILPAPVSGARQFFWNRRAEHAKRAESAAIRETSRQLPPSTKASAKAAVLDLEEPVRMRESNLVPPATLVAVGRWLAIKRMF